MVSKRKYCTSYEIQEKLDANFKASNINDLCASIQHHICTYLLKPVAKLMKEREVLGLAVVGGVSAKC